MPETSSTNYNSGPRGPDFKFELLPLHSPLLRQSLLVSFPPLIDMLKFSGYPYLIRGQSLRKMGSGRPRRGPAKREKFTTLEVTSDRHCFSGPPRGTKAQHQATLEGYNDARTGMPPGIPRGAMCVQRFDDSLNSAIHITYRISLRSSSMPEPRDPLLKVFCYCDFTRTILFQECLMGPPTGAYRPRATPGTDMGETQGPPKQHGK